MNEVDWIGSLGVLQILIAYFLNITGKIQTTHLSFILLNLMGAGMACLASVMLHYLPFIILEAIWAMIALRSLILYIKLI